MKDFQNRIEAIQKKHRGGAPGLVTSTSLVKEIDRLVDQVVENTSKDFRKEITLGAVGGYGRQDLSFHSDVDLIFIFHREIKPFQNDISLVLQSLWEKNLDVSHRVFDIRELGEVAGKDLSTYTSLLEWRPLAGPGNEIPDRLRSLLDEEPFGHFLSQKRQEIDTRVKKYGHSAQLLEPNVKESSGGLRDVHSLFWLFRNQLDLRVDQPDCVQMLRHLHQQGSLETDQFQRISDAFEFVLRVRHSLHLESKGRADWLRFPVQSVVAKSLHYTDTEEFLHDYYFAAREIHRYFLTLLSRFSDGADLSPGMVTVKNIDRTGSNRPSTFTILGDRLSIEGSENGDMIPFLEAFLYFQANEIQMGEKLRQGYFRNRSKLETFIKSDPAACKYFQAILSGGKNIGRTLRLMHELDVLGIFIPEWVRLTCHIQHDVYHYYTTDEHSFVGIEKLEALSKLDTHLLPRNVFEEIGQKDILYLSFLLHDIGKAYGKNHSLKGARFVPRILARLGYSPVQAGLVAYLVRHHLIMEQFAFRRNMDEPQTIQQFTRTVDTHEKLDYLFLIAYADLNSLNPGVWSEWKGQLLNELYLKAYQFLEKGHLPDETRILKSSYREKWADHFQNDSLEIHLAGMTEEYWKGFSEEEIQEHIRRIQRLTDVDVIFNSHRQFTEVTILSSDKPFRLSEICGVLSFNDVNILEAKIFTRSDGIILDRFRGVTFPDGKPISENQQMEIVHSLRRVVRGEDDVDEMFTRHIHRWRRKKKIGKLKNAQVQFNNQLSDRFTILDVIAPDSLGLLYRLTRTLSELGLNIYTAKIATKVDNIFDAFYVQDVEGKKITDPVEQQQIRQTIITKINSIRR